MPTAVIKFLQAFVEVVLVNQLAKVGPKTPLFWSTWGGVPWVRRHGVAMEVLEQHHDLEEVRALLGHARIDTTQVYTSIRPPQLKRAVSFYEEKALQMLSE